MAVADGDDEVVDLADRIALGVQHGPADGLAQVEHGCHLAVGTSRRRWRDHEGSRSAVRRRDGPGSRCRRRVRRRWDWDRRPRGCIGLGCGILTVVAHEGPTTLAECSPARSGRSTTGTPSTMVLPTPGLMAARRPNRAMPPSDCARACGSRGRTACLGRVVRGLADHVLDRDRRPGIDLPPVHRQRTERASATHRLRSPPTPMPQPVEAELAESLDTVLRIIGRLAASHDRAELVRMIVDETKRALARRRGHDPPAPRRAPRAGRLGRPPRRVRQRDPVDRLRCRPHRRGHPCRTRDGVAGHPRRTPRHGRALSGGVRACRTPRRPAVPRQPRRRRPDRRDPRSSPLDERRGRVHGHARDRMPRSP